MAHIRAPFPLEHGWRETGKAEKPSDFRTAPLCALDHLDGPAAQHKMIEIEFWRLLRIYPPTFCAALVSARIVGTSGEQVIREAAAGGFPWPKT